MRICFSVFLLFEYIMSATPISFLSHPSHARVVFSGRAERMDRETKRSDRSRAVPDAGADNACVVGRQERGAEAA